MYDDIGINRLSLTRTLASPRRNIRNPLFLGEFSTTYDLFSEAIAIKLFLAIDQNYLVSNEKK